MDASRVVLLLLAVYTGPTACQQDTITKHRYSRYYYTNSDLGEMANIGNCGHFTCEGNSRLNDPVLNNRISITMQTPIFNGTIVQGNTVQVPSLRSHFSVTYSFNQTGNDEYSYSLHIHNLNAGLVGKYECELGFAAARKAEPQLLSSADLNKTRFNYNAHTSILKVYDINNTFPRIFDVVLRVKNGSTVLFNLSRDSNELDVRRWACEEEVHVDCGTRSSSAYPCGYIYQLYTITPAKDRITLKIVSGVICGLLILAIVTAAVQMACTSHVEEEKKAKGSVLWIVLLIVAAVCLIIQIVFVVKEKLEFSCKSVGFGLSVGNFVLLFILAMLLVWIVICRLRSVDLCCRKKIGMKTHSGIEIRPIEEVCARDSENAVLRTE